MDRCHLYLPLVDSSGTTYPYAEVTLLDGDGLPIDEPVYLDPVGGAPQRWPVLFNPAVVNLWTDNPLRVTVQAALPDGATFTRPGVDITPAPAAAVRSEHPVQIGSADGLSSESLLAVSPDGTADWQVLDVLRFHQHEGDAPQSTVLGPADPTDVYPAETWAGSGIAGSQGQSATSLGALGTTNGPDAVVLSRASAAESGVAAGAGADAAVSGTALGAGANTDQLEQVAVGRAANAGPGAEGGVAVGSGVALPSGALAALGPNVQITPNGSVLLGSGPMPDLSWLSTEPYVAFLDNTVTGRFLAARQDAVLAGPASTFGAFGATGTYQPLVNSASVTTSTPGRTALLSLMSALDQLGLVYLTDGAIDDELADFTKTFDHSANMVLETGDSDGSKAGDLTRARRQATGPATVTYRILGGVRDFRVRVFASQPSGPDPATLATELVADVSPDGTTWTRITLAWQALTATAASWYQTWAANARPLPPDTKYVRLTADLDPAANTPQIGRVIVRPPASTTVSTGLTATTLTSPDRLQVSDSGGVLATLTVGARTVAVRGPQRTFTENKRPFTDDFDRTTTNGWGVSPGGGNWSNANGTSSDYSVSGGLGRISMSAANSSRHTSLIDNVTDFDARLSWSLDVMPVGAASSLSMSFGYTSVNDQYRARLSVLTTGTVQLTLEKEVGGTVTTLGALTTVGTGYVVGDVWHIRAQRVGTTLRCRAWKDGTTEPSTWVHDLTDSALGAGRIGVRCLASSGSTAPPFTFRVHDIQLYSGTWPTTPTVTHTTWVRLLDTPFTGTWTQALASRIAAWATDTSPDILAHAMDYITGGPGEAQYGPMAADGTRIEGADFHDYLGQDWTFSNGETQAAAPAELHCLDCSGFVRMIYGYHGGIPMVRNANLNGINLPRQTKDIGVSGPGILIADSASTAPALTGLQIGDVPHFDADTSDPVAGQLDHNGIYLGVDSAGNHRFINSRKTPNGPTMADLGGASLLNGAGLYATSLRKIRRF